MNVLQHFLGLKISKWKPWYLISDQMIAQCGIAAVTVERMTQLLKAEDQRFFESLWERLNFKRLGLLLSKSKKKKESIITFRPKNCEQKNTRISSNLSDL